MIPFFVILGIVLPPAVWLLGYCTLDPDDEDIPAAKKRFREYMIRTRHFWGWVIYIAILSFIFSGLGEFIARSIDLYLHGG